MRPAGGVLFNRAKKLVHGHGHSAYDDQPGKSQCQPLLRARTLHQVANAGVTGGHFGQHGADKGSAPSSA